jgi:hypothetical protein
MCILLFYRLFYVFTFQAFYRLLSLVSSFVIFAKSPPPPPNVVNILVLLYLTGYIFWVEGKVSRIFQLNIATVKI